jgi:hypothetical protein
MMNMNRGDREREGSGESGWRKASINEKKEINRSPWLNGSSMSKFWRIDLGEKKEH